MGTILGLLVVSAIAGASPGAVPAGPPAPLPADLRLEWRDPRNVIEGSAGDTVEVRYRLRNIGGRDAFAVVVRAHTSLGAGSPERLQPGPKAGASHERHLSIALATGMRELCIEAMLQNLDATDPPDPNPRDNRICSPVHVAPGKESAVKP